MLLSSFFSIQIIESLRNRCYDTSLEIQSCRWWLRLSYIWNVFVFLYLTLLGSTQNSIKLQVILLTGGKQLPLIIVFYNFLLMVDISLFFLWYFKLNWIELNYYLRSMARTLILSNKNHSGGNQIIIDSLLYWVLYIIVAVHFLRLKTRNIVLYHLFWL